MAYVQDITEAITQADTEAAKAAVNAIAGTRAEMDTTPRSESVGLWLESCRQIHRAKKL